MKGLILAVLLLALMGNPEMVVAQQQTAGEQIVVNINDLPPELVTKLKAEQQMRAVSNYANWADEVATAADKILGSVSNHATEFSETDLGRFAMILIAWKVVGSDLLKMSNDLIGYLVGIPLFFFGSIAMLWSYRRQCIPRRILVSKESGPDGKGVVKKYDIYDPNSHQSGNDWDKDDWAVFHAVIFVLLFLISVAIIFT